MPLRALSDEGDLQSFNLSAVQWDELKSSYKGRNLRMPCCLAQAIPKTSTLGNFFFAHSRRGDCATAPESAEHLYCKTLIARAATAAGWDVTSERRGVSPNGDTWVADIFCTKGSAQVALEVQMSPQPLEETLRRQARYEASNVRAAWFLGTKLHDDLKSSSRVLPMFGLSRVELGKEPTVGIIEVGLSTFIESLLLKRMKWMPYSHLEPLYLATLRRDCSKCHKTAGLIFGWAEDLEGLPRGALTTRDIARALEHLYEVMSNGERALLGLSYLTRAANHRPNTLQYWQRCPHCGITVSMEGLVSKLQAASQSQEQASNFQAVYFDRQAADSGAWVLISEDGEYQPVAALI